MSTIHVRYDGESHDLDFESLFTPDRLASIGVLFAICKAQ